MTTNRILWQKKQHEAKVEKFYGSTVENFGDFHGGYLNFGLWEEGIIGYVEAAENLVKNLSLMMNIKKESKLLDIAIGMGSQDIFIHNNFKCSINAVDVTYNHVKIAQKRIIDFGLSDKIKVIHGTATKLPFDNNSFTHVLSIEGPEHFNTREDFFKEAYRVLQEKGIICLSDYTLKRPPKNIFEKFLLELGRKFWCVPKENIYNSEIYKEKLENAGFRNIEIKEVGKLTIPGYYYEQKRIETRNQLRKIRGFIATDLGFIIDYVVFKLFKKGLIEYILVKAEK